MCIRDRLEKTVNERGISSRTMRTAKSRIGVFGEMVNVVLRGLDVLFDLTDLVVGLVAVVTRDADELHLPGPDNRKNPPLPGPPGSAAGTDQNGQRAGDPGNS